MKLRYQIANSVAIKVADTRVQQANKGARFHLQSNNDDVILRPYSERFSITSQLYRAFFMNTQADASIEIVATQFDLRDLLESEIVLIGGGEVVITGI